MEFEDNFNLSFINERMMHSNYFNNIGINNNNNSNGNNNSNNNQNNQNKINKDNNRFHPYQIVKPQIQYLQIPINNNSNNIFINNNTNTNNMYSSSPTFSPQSPYQSSPYSSPFPSPKGPVPPQLFLCSTPNSIERSSSSPAPILPSTVNENNSESAFVKNTTNANNSNNKGFYGMTSNLLDLCKMIDNERGVSKEKTRMLTELHDELDLIIKKINKVKKNKLPYPPLPSDDTSKSFIDLRPRRNRKCKLMHKENEDNIQCQRCGTKDTPEWRKGPDGCKSLCNACGLYYAKTKKREQEQSNQQQQQQQQHQHHHQQHQQQQIQQQEQQLSLNASNQNIKDSIISISSLINN